MNPCPLCRKDIPAHFPVHACTPAAPAPKRGRPPGPEKERAVIYLRQDTLKALHHEQKLRALTRSEMIDRILRIALNLGGSCDLSPEDRAFLAAERREGHPHGGTALCYCAEPP